MNLTSPIPDAEMPRSSSSAGGEGAAEDVDAFEEEGERGDILLDDLMSISTGGRRSEASEGCLTVGGGTGNVLDDKEEEGSDGGSADDILLA